MNIIFKNAHWHVEAVPSPAIPGYLIIRPNQTVTALSDLSADALASFGLLMASGMKAIQETVGPERIYVIRLGEEVEAIHFHLFPRSRGMMDLYTMKNPGQPRPSGAYLFDWTRRPEIAAQLSYPLSVEKAAEQIRQKLESGS